MSRFRTGGESSQERPFNYILFGKEWEAWEGTVPESPFLVREAHRPSPRGRVVFR